MITVRIGDESRECRAPDFDRWLERQIHGRRRDGIEPCVELEIKEDLAHVFLATCACSSHAGRYRPPNRKEQAIIEAWNRCGMNGAFHVPDLLRFVRQLAGC